MPITNIDINTGASGRGDPVARLRELAARKGRGTLTKVERGEAQGIARARPDLRNAVAELLGVSANSLPHTDGVVVEGGTLDNVTIGGNR